MKRIKLDIKAKFGVVIGVVLVAVALCGWSGIHATNGLNGHVKTLYNSDFSGMRTIAELNVQLGHVQDEAVNYTLTGENSEATELQGRSKVIQAELERLRARPGNSPKEQKLLDRELSLWPGFMKNWDGGKFSVKTGKSPSELAGLLDESISPVKDNMEALAALANTSAKDGYTKAESLASSGKRLTLIMVFVAAPARSGRHGLADPRDRPACAPLLRLHHQGGRGRPQHARRDGRQRRAHPARREPQHPGGEPCRHVVAGARGRPPDLVERLGDPGHGKPAVGGRQPAVRRDQRDHHCHGGDPCHRRANRSHRRAGGRARPTVRATRRRGRGGRARDRRGHG